MLVTCQYCRRPAELTTGDLEFPDIPNLTGKKLWVCRDCDARVGCRGNTDVPLGELGDGKLRTARQKGHEACDPLWREMSRRSGMPEGEARNVAYFWLAEQLGITREECHFGGMSYERILKATVLCRELQAQLDTEQRTRDLL